MAVDSGTYTDDTVWRRRQIAQALADMNNKPIQHWTQGLSNLANTAVLSYDDAKLAQEGKQQDYEARLNQAKAFGLDTSGFKPPEMPDNGYGMIARLLGGGSKSAPTPTPSPAPNPVVSNAAVTPSTGANLPAPPVPWQSGPGFAEIGGRMMGDLQRDFKLTPEQAAGVVGNLGHESGGFGSLQEINPTVPGSRGGFGYAQWTGPRRVAFENWAQSQGLDPTSYDANYGFLRHELTNTPEGKVLDALRAAPDQDAATRIFQDQFLRPGIPHTGSRLSYAKQALGLAGGPPSAAVPFPSGAPQEGMPSFVPQGDRVQMAALPPATMTDASPAGPAPAGAETPSPGLPAFAQNGVPPVAMGAPSSPSPASPQQPPSVAPPSPAMPPPVAAGAPASMSGAPRPSVAGVQVPDGIKRIAGALMSSPRTAGQGQKMVTDFLVKELSRNPLDDDLKREQLAAARRGNRDADTTMETMTAPSGQVYERPKGSNGEWKPTIALPAKPRESNNEIIRDAATGEILSVDRNDPSKGVQVLRQAGPSKDAPTTRVIKQPDGSEVAVQWDAASRKWLPMDAPQGGEAVRAPNKLTEQQSKDLVYYNRGLQALSDLGDGSSLASGAQAAANSVPLVGNYLTSEGFQKANQAGRNYLMSILRKDTGAAITTQEEKIYGDIFLPRPGDAPGTLAQKSEARKQALDAIRSGMGPVEVLALGKRFMSRDDASKQIEQKMNGAPDIDALLKKYSGGQ